MIRIAAVHKGRSSAATTFGWCGRVVGVGPARWTTKDDSKVTCRSCLKAMARHARSAAEAAK